MTWVSQAEVLADVSEIGVDIALVAGRCRATGLDPRSFAPIMGAALALGSRPWHLMEHAYVNDQELIEDLLEMADRVWRRQNAYIRLRSSIIHASNYAAAMFAAAACQDPPNEMDMAYWAGVKGNCLAALEVLAPLPGRLRAACSKLTHAPAELGETYQQVYDLLAQGRVMPHDGRWLTGEETPC